MGYEINIDCKSKNVLLIVDYNIKIHPNQKLGSTYKIDQTISTINSILSMKPSLLSISTHLGRPKNLYMNSTIPIFDYLKNKVDNITYKCISDLLKSGELFNKGINSICDASIIVFTDNTRYYDSDNLNAYYKKFDMILSDAFGCTHRDTPYKAYPGILMQKEIDRISKISRFDLTIMGGSKIEDKLRYINNIDSNIFLGGGLANSILKALGYEVGNNSICSSFSLETLEKSIIINGEKVYSPSIKNGSIVLPIDFLVLSSNNEYIYRYYKDVLIDDIIVDIGEKSLEILKKLINSSETIFWNGPIGKYEDDEAVATKILIKILEKSNSRVVIGGGESLDAVELYSKMDNFYHVSTGGGAMLQYISGMKMPGFDSLINL